MAWISVESTFHPERDIGVIHDAGMQAVERICLAVERRAVENLDAGKVSDRGRLRSSITHRVRSLVHRIVGEVGTNLSYAKFIHDGTGPAVGHARYWIPIEPIKSWLRRKVGFTARSYVSRFSGRGDSKAYRASVADDYDEEITDFARAIQRKTYLEGTKPNPFLDEAFDAEEPTMAERIEAEVLQALAQHATI